MYAVTLVTVVTGFFYWKTLKMNAVTLVTLLKC